MHNLEGMLSTLDPSVRESVKILSYFDALLSERVGVDALLRAAALLAGCPAVPLPAPSPMVDESTDQEFGVNLERYRECHK